MRALQAGILSAALSLSALCAQAQRTTPHRMAQTERLEELLLRSGIPSKAGIDYCVQHYQDSVIMDFEETFGVDVIVDVYMDTDDLGSYYYAPDEDENEVVIVQLPQRNRDELGYYEGSGYAVLTNDEKYFGYSLSTTKRRTLWNVSQTNRFVRGAMAHELAHAYIDQVIAEMRMDSLSVARPYAMPRGKTKGSTFIEEGAAEYCTATMGEVLFGEPYAPKALDELDDPKRYYDVYYKHSSSSLKKFLDSLGLRKGLEVLLHNDPPTSEEMLDMESYFSRLKVPGSDLKLPISTYK